MELIPAIDVLGGKVVRLARGDYELSEPGPERDDEIGRFERIFGRTHRQIGSFVADVRRESGPRRPGP